MKHLKLFEFFTDDIGKVDIEPEYDLSPRSGTLVVVNSNNISMYYFKEAYREVLNYLENNILKNNTSSSSVLIEIIEYVNSITSDLVKSLQIGTKYNFNISDSELYVLNNMINLSVNFWYETVYDNKIIYEFIEKNLSTIQKKIPFNNIIDSILYLDKNIFYYNGFKLDLKTKKWTPPKNSTSNTITHVNDIETFKKYIFQKNYLNFDSNLILNIPDELINNEIRNEYDYILKTKKYNL